MLSSTIISAIQEQLKRDPKKLSFRIPRKWIEKALKEYMDLEDKYLQILNKIKDSDED
ncbi:hypothetical protein GF354_05825 [Candidatus Peregrinibacteria bacterium]|nr:hypothetical protein [Candidatus Peregrinibacteria bacterium]